MKLPLTRLALTAILVALTLAPAGAADAIFPPGSRIGLTPPPGMTLSKSFVGFENREHEVAILLFTLPAEAYDEIEKSASADELKKQGITVEKREPFKLADGKGFMMVGRQDVEKKRYRKWMAVAGTADLTAMVSVQVPEAAKATFPDAAIRAALASLTVRKTVPDEEKLALIPFRIGDLSGFRIGSIVPGRAILLTDAEEGAKAPGDHPRIVAIAGTGGPAQSDDRDNFARRVFGGLPDVKDVRITGAEGMRIGGQQGHQILAEGKDTRTDADVTIVQWLRFGGGVYLQMVGVARKDAWTQTLTRFRAVRDSIEPR